MAQLHCYVPDALAARIQEKADQAHLSVSEYLARIVAREVESPWPPDYFDVFGGWQGDPLERAPEGDFEVREHLG